MCNHTPECPAIDQPGWDTAATLVHHDDLGWRMLCNGAVVLDAAVTPLTAVPLMPARATRARTRTRTNAPSRERTAQPIAA